MMEVQEKKKCPKIDEFVVLLNAQMDEQINNKKKLCKMLRKRKSLPGIALHVWRYNRMHRKDNIFSAPLVHGKLAHGFSLCILVLRRNHVMPLISLFYRIV
jgi:hypothetical protein